MMSTQRSLTLTGLAVTLLLAVAVVHFQRTTEIESAVRNLWPRPDGGFEFAAVVNARGFTEAGEMAARQRRGSGSTCLPFHQVDDSGMSLR